MAHIRLYDLSKPNLHQTNEITFTGYTTFLKVHKNDYGMRIFNAMFMFIIKFVIIKKFLHFFLLQEKNEDILLLFSILINILTY